MERKLKTSYILLLITGIFFGLSCAPEKEIQHNNLIISEDFEDGIFYVEYLENGFDLQIDTNNPAVFLISEDKASIDIDPSGTADLNHPPGVYYVDYYYENTPDHLLTLPLLITPNISMAKNTINLLKKMENENGGYALVLRHTQATLGNDYKDSPMPEWWKSCDPDVARQIDEEGKRNSKIIGNAIKKLKIPIGAAVSSEFCRAVTIEFMELEISYQIDGRLNHRNENPKSQMYKDVFDIIKEGTHADGIH